ncbi:MAG: non-ribosomal peptide synthetase [bacterium]
MDFALSPHQERLWFIDQFERGQVYPHPPVYHNLPLVIAGRGELTPERFKTALTALVERHEVLRTRLDETTVPARQTITADNQVPFEVTELPTNQTDDEVVAHLIAANAAPFTLHRLPLIRAQFVRVAEAGDGGRFWCLITVHHLIADRPSLQLFAQELAATLRGESVSPPELHYPDFVAWQQELPADALEALLFYWKWQLRGRIPPLELPTAFPRAAIHTFTAQRHAFTWSETTTNELRRLATQQGDSPAVVALGLFKVLLQRYAQQEEIVIGTSLPNRRQPGTGNLAGPVANLVVLRSNLDRNSTVAEFLQDFSRTFAEAREHQEMPFDPLVRELSPTPDMSRTALFDVLATAEERPPVALDGGNLGPLQLIDLNLGYGKYDLALHLQLDAAATTTGVVTFNGDLHQPEFVAQLSRHFETLVLASAAEPDTPLADLSLLSPAEIEQQLIAFNPIVVDAPRDETIISLFGQQVARQPERIAITHDDQQISYRELEVRSNQLAHCLLAAGVQSEALVAVALDRSSELIIALLAVLKSGGAYLPVDPTHPAERIHFILTDSASSHLISTREIITKLPPPPESTSITLLDQVAAELNTLPASAPTVTPTPANLAYCIYTSGSTGQPKGVLVEHRQVVRLLFHDHNSFTFSADDVWTMFHSACFDFSVWEMYGPLLYGGRLVLVPSDTARDAEAFADLVISAGVTVLNQTPSAFRQFDAALNRRGYPALALREVIFGGEALAPVQLQGFAAAYPEVALINMYGITETTVHVTYHRVTADDIAQNRPIIGRPLPTTTTRLLDAGGKFVPIGVPAEIWVGGEGLARGYLNRPTVTADKFVADPLDPSARLYRSGDLGALQFDGTMLHLGRIDDQVQIRGFRVELGEIQTRLLQHAAITAAELISRVDPEGQVEIVAYLVAETEFTTAALRQHVADALPDYMVPATFVLLDTLPLTRNGKVDRDALPDPSASPTAAGPEYSAPTTEAEIWVAATYASLLKAAAPIGRNHHFFELGGHSLLAAQLISRVRAEFKIELPLKHVFTSPTVAAFAAVIDAACAQPEPAPTPITRTMRRSVVDLTSLGQP